VRLVWKCKHPLKIASSLSSRHSSTDRSVVITSIFISTVFGQPRHLQKRSSNFSRLRNFQTSSTANICTVNSLMTEFDVHRSVHRNIVLQYNQQDAPVSQIIYSCKALYMFRTVFPSIIRRSKLQIRQQAYVQF
jgi:hypothetical protein